jgi:hypothetical protein
MRKCQTCNGLGLLVNGFDTDGPLLECPECAGTGIAE